MIYVTETMRFLSRPYPKLPQVLEAVRAKVSDKPDDFYAIERIYTPEKWRELFAQPEVMYRYRKEPYRPIKGLAAVANNNQEQQP